MKTMREDYIVTIGSDVFGLKAKDNQEARYRAANMFKTKYGLKTSAADIASYARTKLKGKSLTTRELLVELKKNSDA